MSINKMYHTLLSNDETERKLGDMAANIVLQNFDYRYATLLFFNSTLYYGVELFLREFNYNIIVNKGAINSKLVKVIHQYVLFGNEYADFEQLLESLAEQEMKNTGKFVIICQSQYFKDCNENELTNLFQHYRIVDIVLVKPRIRQAVGFTYFPISNGNCNNVKPIEISSSNSSRRITTNLGNLFGKKLKQFALCPLFVSTFIQSPYMNLTNGTPTGADGDLLCMIAYGLNATLKMNTPHHGSGWGFREKNGTWTGSLGDTYDNLANMSMISGAITLSRFSDFEISSSYSTIHIVWITHPAAFQSAALKLLHPFEHSTRIALVASFILVIMSGFIVKTKTWTSLFYKTRDDQASKSIVFYSWMICMGQALVKLPSKSVVLHITFLWVYYCFIIRTMYQVYLISSLKAKFYEDQIQTIEDAMSAKYPFGGGASLKEYFIDYPEVYKNWINLETSEIVPTVFDISKGKKFVIAMNWNTAKVLIKKHKIKLHLLPQKIVSSPSVLFLKKYSPLTESINLVLSRLITGGFPQKFHKKYTSTTTLSCPNENEQEILKIVHFTTCYVLLILGWFISAVFFLLEVYFGKIYKHPMLQ